MEELPIELVGERNFPDIELESLTIKPKEVRLTGEIAMRSIIDHWLIDGFVELIIQGSDIKFMEKNDNVWQRADGVNLTAIYFISIEDDNIFIFEGSQEDNSTAKIVIQDAVAKFAYL